MPPWAVAACDVLGERTPDGQYAYPIGVILVPRQCAKTTTALDLALGRGMLDRDYRAAYAAQTGHVTTERMGDRFTEVEGSPLASRLKVRRSQGTERITNTRTASYVKAYPPIAGSLRSSALDLVVVDEAQEHDDDPLGRALDATILPTFTTRPRRQLILLGTAPDRPGTYLGRYAALARAGAPGVALIDYGADEGEDPDDPATWHRRHPGLAAGLTDTAFLKTQRDLDPDLFAREFLNVWPVHAPGGAITGQSWTDASRHEPAPAPGTASFGVDVSPGGGFAVVAAAWPTGPGRVHAAIVQAAPGTAWLDAALPDLLAAHRPVTWSWDALSPAAAIMARLRIPGTGYGFPDLAAGTAWVIEALGDRLTVTPDEDLDRAAASAVLRTVGDTGRAAWGRKASGAPITPLVAMTAAVWSVANPPAAPFLV